MVFSWMSPPIISLAVAATFWGVCVCVWEEGGNLNTSPEGNSQISTPGKKVGISSSPLPPTTLFPSSPFHIPSKLEGGRAMRTTRVGWVGGGHFYTGH